MSRPEPPRGGVRAITSLQNERVKLIRSLEMRKARRETGLFVAEGASVLVTAREAGWTPRMLVFLSGSAQAGIARGLLAWAEAAGAECLEVSPAVLAKLAAKDNPQTMLGVFEQRWADEPPRSFPRRRESTQVSAVDAGADPRHRAGGASSTRRGDDGLWVALEAVRDPGNLGTIMRTVDAVGASGVALVGTSCDPYSREAVRASMGSIFNVPLVRMNQERFLAWVAGWTGDVVGTHLSGREDFRAVSYRAPTLLAMGSEGPGLSPALAAACSRLVKIPMAGRLDSLNLAVATALMLYEIHKGSLHL
jgi:TrmH family RNA methyltransferase